MVLETRRRFWSTKKILERRKLMANGSMSNRPRFPPSINLIDNEFSIFIEDLKVSFSAISTYFPAIHSATPGLGKILTPF